VLGRDARRVGRFLIYTAGDRWLAGKPIGNAEVRRVLGKDPRGESEKDLQSLYRFFSETVHPNRSAVAHRFLGDGNRFVLGAIGKPSLAMLADYAMKTLDLWFWFGAFVCYTHLDVLEKIDPISVSITTLPLNWQKRLILADQFARVVAQEQQEIKRIKKGRGIKE
jgi:hypothetical protein